MTREEAERALVAAYRVWRSEETDGRMARAAVTNAALTLARILTEQEADE